jgi:hypothetical protein
MASNSAVLFCVFAGFSLRVDQVAGRNREAMKRPGCASRLIIVCGLPGSGKTTHAKLLEAELGAVRLCADDWMDALNVNLYDESMRAKVEALQWDVARRLLALALLVLKWNCIISQLRRMCSSKGFSSAIWRIHRSNETTWCNGPKNSRNRRRKRWYFSMSFLLGSFDEEKVTSLVALLG